MDDFLRHLNKITLGFGVGALFYYFGYQYYKTLFDSYNILLPVEEFIPSQELIMWGYSMVSPLAIALFLIFISNSFISSVHWYLVSVYWAPKNWTVKKTENGSYIISSYFDARITPKNKEAFDDLWNSKEIKQSLGTKQRVISNNEIREHFTPSLLEIRKSLTVSEQSRMGEPLHSDAVNYLIVFCVYLVCLDIYYLYLDSKPLLITATYCLSFLLFIFLKTKILELWRMNLAKVLFYSAAIFISLNSLDFFISKQVKNYSPQKGTISLTNKVKAEYLLLFENNQNLIVYNEQNQKTYTIPKRNIEYIEYEPTK